jgi:hypothetical protein
MNVISFFGYTFFPLSKTGYANTFQDKMNIIVTALVILLTIVSLILFAIGFLWTNEHKRLGAISLGTLLLLIIGAMLINLLPKEYFGVAERVNIYSIVMFTGVLAMWMKRYCKDLSIRL